MPTYKGLPRSKKKPLPFYRPIDRLMVYLWEKRQALTPILIIAVVALAILVGVRMYSEHYEAKASQMSAGGDLAKVVENYPRSEAAKLSRVRLGKQALDAKDYDQAIGWYAPVADDLAAPAILRIGAIQNMALAYLKKGDGAKAVSLLERAAKDQTNESEDYSELLLARTRELNGQTDQAREAYKGLSEGAKEAGIRAEAKERLSWMESQK